MRRVEAVYVPAMRPATAAVVLTLAALALAACGQSDQDKAMNTVCDAKDDMAKQVDELSKMTPATFTTDAAKKNLDAIRNDFKDISDAQGDLSDDRRREVEAATNEFTRSVKAVFSDLGTSLSASDAKTKLTDALQQLGTSYQQTLARLDCG